MLTGSDFGPEIAGSYEAERRSRAGQSMIVLNIEAMQLQAEFNGRMEELISQIKSASLAQDCSERRC